MRNLRPIIGGALVIFLFIYPLFASDFFALQIGVQSFYWAIMAMSLIFLAGYGGMVSLGQIAMFGVSGYTLAILTATYQQNWGPAVGVAVLIAALFGLVFGLVAVRTTGIYFLMITLAQAMLVYYFANQDRLLTNGHAGINGVPRPFIGPFSLHDPQVFYYVALVTALLIFGGLSYIIRSPFGLALQGVRDNPQRMRSLGYNVTAHRVAAFVLAAVVAGVAGILGAWYNGRISPGTIDLTRNINLLVMAVLGGLVYLEGAFVGAIFFILVTTFASSFTERFNLLIGLSFLLVALFLDDGLTGLFYRVINRLSQPRRKNLPEEVAPPQEKEVEQPAISKPSS